MAERYVLWDRKTPIHTPIGKVYTPEEWMKKYPWMRLPNAVPVVSSCAVNGKVIFDLYGRKHDLELLGETFEDGLSDQELLDCIEEIETRRAQEKASNEVEHPTGRQITSDGTLEITPDEEEDPPYWTDAQKAFTQIVYRLLGDDYYTRFSWVQKGRANALALQDILYCYPRWLCRIVVHIANFFRS